ncbi:MAG: L-seryl-tRNA(Sec) selenium transferase [Gemmatimonadota bacterium]
MNRAEDPSRPRPPRPSGPDARRALPAIDRLLAHPVVRVWEARWGREAVRRSLRESLEAERDRLAGAEPGSTALGVDDILADALARLGRSHRPSLRPVLNATGVVLHTNLGRAPLAQAAREALDVAGTYSNLEYELEAGGRGSRYDHCRSLLRELTGAEEALVVNNNAAAVALAINELALAREVVVSRGELVEIGGSFRIPAVVARSGGILREVGTTNRTRLSDYRAAIGPQTGVLLKVHPSNYRVEGFVSEASLEELVRLGREGGVPVVHDLGSGLLRPELLPGFPPEPAVGAAVAAGADLVTWSGDKLLGGPQAGILLGRREVIERLRSNPLLRAFRVDKMTLAALEATLSLYRRPDRAGVEVPVLRMLREDPASVEERARRVAAQCRPPDGVTVVPGRTRALVGGGSFPGFLLESAGLAVRGIRPEVVEARCRGASPPLIGRVEAGVFWLDFRTLLPGQEEAVVRVLTQVLEAS